MQPNEEDRLFLRPITGRLAFDDGTELVVLDCGHRITRIIPDPEAKAMECPECVNSYVEAHRTIMEQYRKKVMGSRSHRQALVIIAAVRNELKLGTKHYDKRRPDVVLTDEKEILQALVDGHLLIEPVPARRRIFDA